MVNVMMFLGTISLLTVVISTRTTAAAAQRGRIFVCTNNTRL